MTFQHQGFHHFLDFGFLEVVLLPAVAEVEEEAGRVCWRGGVWRRENEKEGRGHGWWRNLGGFLRGFWGFCWGLAERIWGAGGDCAVPVVLGMAAAAVSGRKRGKWWWGGGVYG